MRSAQQIFAWFKKEYSLEPEEQIEDLWFWYQNSIENTRLIEYKLFIFVKRKKTICSRSNIDVWDHYFICEVLNFYLGWEKIKTLRRKISSLCSEIQEASSIISLQALIKILRMNMPLIMISLVHIGKRKEMSTSRSKTMTMQSIATRKR